MPLSSLAARALRDAGIEFKEDAPLARLTWWRVGGPADALVHVSTLDALQRMQVVASTHELPVFVLGNGSNLLVSDAGVRGLVVKLEGDFLQTQVEDHLLTAGGGLRLQVLLGRAKRHGWPGLEAMAGIPGTIGGAVRMNAGTSMGEVSDRLVSVDVVHRDGTHQRLPASRLNMGYRTCHLPAGAIVASAHLRLEGNADESQQRIKAFLARRKATQPLDAPSCGSTFRNPPGDAAGRLIDACGLKSTRIGGAVVSEKHANFLLNTGGATAENLRDLIEHVAQRVLEETGVVLHPEVKLAGDWGRPGWH
jgi:UDP-N-acetylmuramate dehydrogenase